MRTWALAALAALVACGRTVPSDGAVVETCNGADDDGDGAVDEGLRAAWYADGDGDGYGAGYAVERCTRAAGWVATGGDCDDGDAARAPGRTELCNGADDDCDGELDEGLLSTWYVDVDRDGWGDADAPMDACTAPAGATAEPGDCDDADATVFPGGSETCDGVDQDCDGAVDDGVLTTFHADGDADGYGDAAAGVGACAAPEGYTRDGTDCDDGDPTASPAGTEACNTWVDEDCDGTDNGCTLAGALSLAQADRTLLVEGDSTRGVVIGDVNGDGYSDLAVGRPSWRENTLLGDEPAYEMGAVSVLFGGAGGGMREYGASPGDVEADLDLSSGTTDVPTRLGETVVLADIDGDGVDDLLAGAPGWDPAGRVLVAPGPASAWGFAVRGEDAEGELGSTLAVGDADGDGAMDVLVGEAGPYASVFLLQGPLSSDVAAEDVTVAEWVADRPTVYACDANGDGLSDVLLGSAATVYVALAPHAGLSEAEDIDILLDGASSGGTVGCADLDDDGYEDLLVGSPGDASAGAASGAMFRVPGPVTASTDVSAYDAVLGEAAGDQLGASLSLVGDVDGDGEDDLALGAPGADGSTGADDRGAIYLLTGPFAGTVDLADATRFEGAEADDGAGAALGAAGDVNADGYADFAVVGGSFATTMQLIYGRGM
ncbi:MAG: MopE-related protein [Pseudomonadota bacterium]|nr:MopE-related protein [Pseudomonadota bacterium]